MREPNQVAPGRGNIWRPRTKREGEAHRCGVISLEWGDCSQQPLPGSVYCYYHHKVLEQVVTWFVDHRNREVNPAHYYKVWPLPQGGYVLLPREDSH